MTDMLVRLYALPPVEPALTALGKRGVVIRHAMSYERLEVVRWVEGQFGEGWAGECEAAFSRLPVSCFLATLDGCIQGFACYECTCRGFFGPMGVDPSLRGSGVGSALLLSCLHALASLGYAYGIVGGVEESCMEFYRRVAGAVAISDSSPGVYRDRLRHAP